MMLENTNLIRYLITRQIRGTAAAVAAIAVMLVSGTGIQRSSADDAPKADPQSTAETSALEYHCIVVDKDTGKGIPNARVTVRRAVSNSEGYRLIDETGHVTDADGKYDVVIPPDQVTMTSFLVEFEVAHDDYAAKRGIGLPLTVIRTKQMAGERLAFERIELETGEAVTGIVVSPDGKPLSGIKVQSFSKSVRDESDRGSFNDTVTDDQGRFHICLHKDGEGMLWIVPKDFASIEKFLAKKRGDLGTIRLSDGTRVTGQVTSVEGQPIAGLSVRIDFTGQRNMGQLRVASSVRRGSFSDAEGRFEFDPLPPGDYQLTPSEYLGDPLKRDFKIYAIPDVFPQQRITIKEGVKTQLVSIQAVPHVILSGQLYDSNGEKRGGDSVTVNGRFDGILWNSRARLEKDGSFSVRIPHGLQRAQVRYIGNQDRVMRYRRSKDQPIQNGDLEGIELGTINDDIDGLEVIYFKPAVVLISAVDEDQKPVPDFRVVAAYPWGKQRMILKGNLRTDIFFELQADGRYRTRQMLPNEDVTFKLTAPGFESTSKTVKLTEGETQELVVNMTKETTEKTKVGSE